MNQDQDQSQEKHLNPRPTEKQQPTPGAAEDQGAKEHPKEVDDLVQGKKLENEDREGDATDTDITTRA